MKKIVVNKKYNGKKLENFVKENFPNLPYSMFHKSLRNKDFKINQTRTNKNIELFEGDTIEIYIKDEILYGIKPINIIYEDDNILILNKPSGICVEKSINNEPTLLENAQKTTKIPLFACHRLDRNTTGLVIFAKNEKALEIITQKFKNHEITKYYKCTVIGIPKNKKATLTHYLEKDNKQNRVYIHDKPSKNTTQIITKYEVTETLPNNLSNLDIELITGKTHQIRAHLAYIGHPILGDGKYGINKINKELGVPHQVLESNKIIFNFTTDSGILNYLNKKEIKIK